MSDIFREVEEDVRKERLEKIWKAYGDYIIAAGVLIFAAIAGFQLWQKHEADERNKASAAFVAAQHMTDPAAAAGAFDTLAKNSPKGYALVSRLAAANALYASGNAKDAIDQWKQIAADDDGLIGEAARLRAAWGLADSATRNELADLLAPLNNPASAWSPLAREVLAYADYRALDLKGAQAKYEALATDARSPDALRNRARAMAQFIAQGGAADFGTVPPPEVPAPGATPGAPAAPGK